VLLDSLTGDVVLTDKFTKVLSNLVPRNDYALSTANVINTQKDELVLVGFSVLANVRK